MRTGRAPCVAWWPLLIALAGSCASEQEYLRPWFRIRHAQRYVLAPHALEWGGGKRAELQVGSRWRSLDHAGFGASVVGDVVVVREWEGGDGEGDARPGAIYFYHPGEATPVRLDGAQCPTAAVSADTARVGCFSCGDGPAGTALEHARNPEACRRLHVRVFDDRASLLTDATLDSPIEQPNVEGPLPSGEWILVEQRPSDDFLFFYGPSRRFAVDPVAGVIAALPLGADPLRREVDAAGRAAKLLAEVPVRDREVAALGGALDEEERADGRWRRVHEVVDHLHHAGVALEPTVPVRAGACYRVVARASGGMTRLLLRVAAADPDLARQLALLERPPLESAAGSGRVSVDRCVPAASALRALRFRIEDGEGGGYVVARIYERD